MSEDTEKEDKKPSSRKTKPKAKKTLAPWNHAGLDIEVGTDISDMGLPTRTRDFLKRQGVIA